MLPLLVAAALAQAPESVGVAALESTEAGGPEDAHTVLLWQGFRHFWLRHAAVGFHLPHRVSRFESFLSGERDVATPEGTRTEATFTFGQSTGVDGDWMEPEGYAARVSSPDLEVHRGVVHVQGVDTLVDPEHPKAFERFDEVIRVPSPPAGQPYTAAAVLQGLSFRSRCASDPSECNSDGIWPYRFRVELEPCEAQGAELACPVIVEVGRAWTPSLGGVRPFGRKPINPQVAIDVEVAWAVLVGPTETFQATRFTVESALPSTRDIRMGRQIAPVAGLGPGLTAATVGLSALAFEFVPTRETEPLQQRGRYIGGWSVEVGAAAVRPETQELDIAHAGGIWLPRTVRTTGVSLELGMNILLFRHPAAHVDEDVVATGLLCSDSHGAPAYSSWNECQRILGEERTRQSVGIVVGP